LRSTRSLALATIAAAIVLLPSATTLAQPEDVTDDDEGTANDVEGLGVAPTFITVESALRGNSYSDNLILINGLAGDREFTFLPTGDIAPWASFLDGTGVAVDSIVLPQEGTATVETVLAVPGDIANGTYRGQIEISGRPVDTNGDATAAGVAIGAIVPVAIEVGGDMQLEGRLADVRVEPAEVGMPLRILASFVNGGNVGFAPAVQATITRVGQPVDILSIPPDERIDAGRTEELELIWDTIDALPGEYTVDVTATADGLQFEPFSVPFRLDRAGEVERVGELESLEVVSVPELGGSVRIRGAFRNQSEVPVEAVLVAEVQRDGQLVGEIRSLQMRASPTNVTDIDVVVDDLQSGVYEVSGKVNFEGRETNTVATNFGVGVDTEEIAAVASSEPGNDRTMLLAAGGAAAVVLVGGLAWLTQRRKFGSQSSPGGTR
jgi:hypothetical protein